MTGRRAARHPGSGIVLTATNGREALAVYEAEGGEVVKRGVAAASEMREAIVKSQVTLEGTVMRTVHRNAKAFIQTMKSLSEERPDEAEIAFGLKATLDADVAVVKVGSEATYTIKLVWKREAKGE